MASVLGFQPDVARVVVSGSFSTKTDLDTFAPVPSTRGLALPGLGLGRKRLDRKTVIVQRHQKAKGRRGDVGPLAVQYFPNSEATPVKPHFVAYKALPLYFLCLVAIEFTFIFRHEPQSRARLTG